jgi:hypothetical protein
MGRGARAAAWWLSVVVVVAAALAPGSGRAAMLTPAPGFPVFTGKVLYDAAMNPAGDLIVASLASANTDDWRLTDPWLASYRVNADGSLTQAPGSPLLVSDVGLGEQIAFSPDGKHVTTANRSGVLGVFAIGADGRLTPIPGSPFPTTWHASSLAYSPNGKLLAVGSGDSSELAVYAIGADGAPTPVAGSPFSFTSLYTAEGVAFSPNSGLLAATDLQGVQMLSVSAAGVPSLVPGSPFGGGPRRVLPAFSPDGRTLAVADGDSGTVSAFSVAANGALTPVPGSPFTGGGARDLAFSPNGKLLATTDPNADMLSLYAVGANGALRHVYGSPFEGPQLSVRAPSFGRNGTLLALGDRINGALMVYKVGKEDQALTFPALGPYVFGQAPVTLAATATSGLTPTYAVTGGPCAVSADKLTITGAGACVVAADQAGDADFAAAPRVTRTITIAKASQSIAFPAQGPYAVGQTAALGATSSSALPVAYTVTSGPCAVSGTTLTTTGAGACVVAADQPGNANYLAAARVTRTITVAPARQVIDFPALGPHVLGDAPVTLAATASSGLPVTYTVSSGPCTLTGTTLTLSGVGECVVAADQPGDLDHEPAETVTRVVVVTAPVAAPDPPAPDPPAPDPPAPDPPVGPTAPPTVFAPGPVAGPTVTTPPMPTTPTPSAARTPVKQAPCSGKKGAALKRCQAQQAYKKALARCDRISKRTRATRKRRSACVAKAKRTYQRALARTRTTKK